MADPAVAANLQAARDAVAYAKSRLTLGAGNKPSDLISSFGESFVCVAAQRSVTLSGPRVSWKRLIWRVAAAAESAGCGNCGEQAAVAFVYLFDHGVRPLDYMGIDPDIKDHAFVAIGRKPNADPSLSLWGPAAVVCDPWAGQAYLAQEAYLKMGWYCSQWRSLWREEWGRGRGATRFRGDLSGFRAGDYPVRTVDRTGGGWTVEVTRAESRTIPAAEFQAPAGFARKTLREMMGQ